MIVKNSGVKPTVQLSRKSLVVPVLALTTWFGMTSCEREPKWQGWVDYYSVQYEKQIVTDVVESEVFNAESNEETYIETIEIIETQN